MRKIIACLSLLILSFPSNSSNGKETAKQLRILFIGDSITDGNWGGGRKPSAERNTTDKNHVFGSGYMYLCAAEFMGHFADKNMEFFNRGISGNTLMDLKNRWQEDVINIKPDVLSILIGTNDVMKELQKNNPSTFDYKSWEEDFRLLLDEVRAANPKIQFVLGSPFAIKHSKTNDRFDERMNMLVQITKILKKAALDYDAIFLDYQHVFDKAISRYKTVNSSHWIWDGIHPTAAGHRLMADLWIKNTKGLLLKNNK